MISKGLVLDSRFSARKSLVKDLQDSGLVRRVVEARSFSDGLLRLRCMHIDACLVGSTITEQAALKHYTRSLIVK